MLSILRSPKQSFLTFNQRTAAAKFSRHSSSCRAVSLPSITSTTQPGTRAALITTTRLSCWWMMGVPAGEEERQAFEPIWRTTFHINALAFGVSHPSPIQGTKTQLNSTRRYVSSPFENNRRCVQSAVHGSQKNSGNNKQESNPLITKTEEST